MPYHVLSGDLISIKSTYFNAIKFQKYSISNIYISVWTKTCSQSLIKLPHKTNHDSTVKVGHKIEVVPTRQSSAKRIDRRLGRDYILIMKWFISSQWIVIECIRWTNDCYRSHRQRSKQPGLCSGRITRLEQT